MKVKLQKVMSKKNDKFLLNIEIQNLEDSINLMIDILTVEYNVDYVKNQLIKLKDNVSVLRLYS